MVNVYVLKLACGKYYVGKTNLDVSARFQQHLRNYGSEWTSKYQPIKIEKVIKNADSFDEDKYTLMYMEKYGVENVRGGPYCRVKLSHDERGAIEHRISSVKDACYMCGGSGHFAYNCEKHKEDSDEESDNEEDFDEESVNEEDFDEESDDDENFDEESDDDEDFDEY